MVQIVHIINNYYFYAKSGFMQNHFVKYGLMMGVASIILNVILYLYKPSLLLEAGSWIGLIIMIYFMVKSVSATKSENSGYLALNESFKSAWLAYVLGSFISSVFMFILVNYIDPTLIDTIRDTQIAVLKQTGQAFNLSEKDIDDQISTIEDTNPFGLAQIAVSIPVSFLFPGAILAIIIAAIMKKNRPDETVV
jgi:hypothetical protein